MPKRTYQPRKRRRAKTHGFRVRMKTQGACGAPQEGTPSAYPRVIRGAWSFPARRGWCGGENLTLCTAPGSAARVPTSLFSFARTNCRRAVSASASKRRWAARWCAIASDGGFERSCAVIAWRYLQDGTSSYTRRARWRVRRLCHWRRTCCGCWRVRKELACRGATPRGSLRASG